MKNAGKWAAGLGALSALVMLSGKRDSDDRSEDNDVNGTSIGWAPALVPFEAQKLEREICSIEPVDLEQWESEVPMCGFFYQTKKKETWLGSNKKSITYQALFNTSFSITKDLDTAQSIAQNSLYRLQLFSVIVAGRWNDDKYGTYATSAKTPVGPHGRGIDLRRVHADNRVRMLEGESPARAVDVFEPGAQRNGESARTGRGGSPPYIWVPHLHEDHLLDGKITTIDCTWPDGENCIEPPPEVRLLGSAVI